VSGTAISPLLKIILKGFAIHIIYSTIWIFREVSFVASYTAVQPARGTTNRRRIGDWFGFKPDTGAPLELDFAHMSDLVSV